MHHVGRSAVLFACTWLLVLQVIGIHRHVDAGADAGLHVVHMHGTQAVHHALGDNTQPSDHGVESDVAAFEQLGGNWPTLMFLLTACVLAVVQRLRSNLRVAPPPTRAGTVRRGLHWRPPLRAPPLAS